MVEVSNSGQFVATIILWPAARNAPTNPTLISGTHELERGQIPRNTPPTST